MKIRLAYENLKSFWGCKIRELHSLHLRSNFSFHKEVWILNSKQNFLKMQMKKALFSFYKFRWMCIRHSYNTPIFWYSHITGSVDTLMFWGLLHNKQSGSKPKVNYSKMKLPIIPISYPIFKRSNIKELLVVERNTKLIYVCTMYTVVILLYYK